jgi:hypothetical protein
LSGGWSLLDCLGLLELTLGLLWVTVEEKIHNDVPWLLAGD